ncbi:MAG: hypothetical protein ACOVVK_12665, partial [Elsteraceae bacterium]
RRSSLALTSTTPSSILSDLASFAALGGRGACTVAAEAWLLIAGVFAGALYVKSRRLRTPAADGLTPEERARVAAILGEPTDRETKA